MSNTHTVDHPLSQIELTRLRQAETDNRDFRRALHQLSGFVVYEALRSLATETVDITTPMAPSTGVVAAQLPLIVPIMRAGLGMLDAALTVLPHASVGFVGLRRDEDTHLPDAYVNTVPEDLHQQPVLVLDPMLATGGSLLHACGMLVDSNSGPITVAAVLAAPEGLAAVEESDLDITVFTAAIDDRLDHNAFIVPGLGDAGDRQFGLQ